MVTQDRCCKNGKKFKMYKFRSMMHNAEELLDELQVQNEQTGPVFKIKNDLRITSVDELPQLFNVLKGEMSIVGPRPPITREVEQYQIQRLLVKLGITCIWKVSGRNSIGLDELVELDLKYIKKRIITCKEVFSKFRSKRKGV